MADPFFRKIPVSFLYGKHFEFELSNDKFLV